MDSANKIASHKIDIPAAARNIGNIDLSSALYDLGGDHLVSIIDDELMGIYHSYWVLRQ